jgi:3-oxoacyl-[acyl-carrier protein] reductase
MKKVVLITGGSRGIGKATAEVFAKNGYSVAINCFANKDRAEETVRYLRDNGGEAICVPADVASEEQVMNMVHNVRKAFGRI